jgi:hypothetical protein
MSEVQMRELKQKKVRLEGGSSDRASALKEWGPEFKVLCNQKRKEKKRKKPGSKIWNNPKQ